MFLQERYGHYSLTDPFLALQRDFECGVPGGDKERRPLGSSPISVLEAVMAHCRKMQERMSAQLAAAESRQKRVRHRGGGGGSLLVDNVQERESKKCSEQQLTVMLPPAVLELPFNCGFIHEMFYSE